MPLTKKLLKKLQVSYPELSFVPGEEFRWLPSTSEIEYTLDDPLADARLLHEVSHALLGHKTYKRDIELIAIERDAWGYAKTHLGPLFSIIIPVSVIDDDMDTYRDWLHSRSICPSCGANGIQMAQREYKCVACLQKWRVNSAIGCELRRYTKNSA